MNITIFSRFYLAFLIFNVGGWVYFYYLLNYTANLTSQTCNNHLKELSDAVKIIIGISMSISTINVLKLTTVLLNSDDDIIFDKSFFNFSIIIILLSIAGFNSLAIFCITSGMTNLKCSDNDSEFGIKLSVYGIIWITFIKFLLIFIGTMRFLYQTIHIAKLHELCVPCFDILRKYMERRIAMEPQIPRYNSNIVSIPITCLKEEPKFLCSVCYDGSITLLLEPCNHICICELCYNSLITKECPICKTNISATKKIYFVSPNPI
jgi:hypothetical protein